VDTDLAEAGVELLLVDLVVFVKGVEVAEGSGETADGLGAAGLDLLLDSVED
jgi:hypothetical protein